MKRFAFILILVCMLAGCQNRSIAPDGADRDKENVTVTESAGYFGFEDELSPENKQVLSEFMPILAEGKAFMAAHMPQSGESADTFEEKSLSDIIHDIDPEYISDRTVQSIAFCDVTGDGQTDIAVLLGHPAGFYCLLCKDGDSFYGLHMPIRWFEGLRENGVFFGSGGAATAYYERLHFSDGVFSTELLGYTDAGYYEANGREVTQEEFETWLDGLLDEKAVRYNVSE